MTMPKRTKIHMRKLACKELGMKLQYTEKFCAILIPKTRHCSDEHKIAVFCDSEFGPATIGKTEKTT